MKRSIKYVVFSFIIVFLFLKKPIYADDASKSDPKDLFKVASTPDRSIIIYGDNKDDKDHDGYDRGSFSYWWKDESTGVEEDEYISNVGKGSDKKITRERYYELVQTYWRMITAVQWYYID